jgi:hypothetical protein
LDASIFVSVGFGLLTFFMTIAAGYFGFVNRVNAKFSKSDERLAKLEVANEVFWKVLDPHLASIIHSPTHKRRDELVDKLLDNSISYAELKELDCLLKIAVDEEKGDKKFVYLLLVIRVEVKLANSMAQDTLKR